jgi:hypothetical protein
MRYFSRSMLAFSAVLLCSTLGAPTTQALDRSVEVSNQSLFPLRNLWGTREGDVNWRHNYLPTSSTLPAKQVRRFNFDDGVKGEGSCTRDLEFDLPGYTLNKGILKLERVNICKADKLVIKNCLKPSLYCIDVLGKDGKPL